MLGVLVHVVGDAINNIGVIISALVIWKSDAEARFYADPIIGLFIAIMIFVSAIPLTKNSGSILLQMAPHGIRLDDIKFDMEQVPGVLSVHELHVWKLDQHKSIASAHVVVDDRTIKTFVDKGKVIMECLHAYGIHSATLQPEARPFPDDVGVSSSASATTLERAQPVVGRRSSADACQLECGSRCGEMRCCSPVHVS
ncbi:Cobalt uptake protein COT1 [Escovopsis weberi]|uniref:Cobalt uptake protein COT1 n=1 Tax=Escovopsis weberi TaxID=150374 RepID=A0A0M8MVL0_ESCWE|nr:Cobalt uptake protein COT1 [Escovopsis weberi]